MKRAEPISPLSRPLGIRIEVDLSALDAVSTRQDAPGGSLEIPVMFEDAAPLSEASGRHARRGSPSNADDSLDVPVTFDLATAEDMVAGLTSTSAVPREGDMIAARYRVLRRLGTGGMGVVYACAHEFLDRPVALKVVRHDTDGDTRFAERLFQEARLAAQIQSPHVVQVLDCGLLPNGSPYIAMELIQGRDLLTVLRQGGPLPAERVVAHMLQACHGLAAAHRHDIIHQDLKLENLILTSAADGAESIKLIDFGISKQLRSGPRGSATDPRNSIGSPHYMSPEQIATPDRVDARTDIWSLGVVMYELLVGNPPFSGTGPHDICLSVLVSPAPDPRAAKPDIPDGVAEIVLRCLEKHPARRFQDAEALASALTAALEPIKSAPGRRPAAESPSSPAEVAQRGSPSTRHSGSWLRALAPMLSAVAALMLSMPALAERPCPLQSTRPAPRVEELRIPYSPRLAPLRGVRLSSLSVWGLPLALGVDSRRAGAMFILRFGGGTREDLQAAEEQRGRAREALPSPEGGVVGPFEAPTMVLARLAAASRAIRRCH